MGSVDRRPALGPHLDMRSGGVIRSERRPAAEEQRLRERIDTFYLSGMKAAAIRDALASAIAYALSRAADRH